MRAVLEKTISEVANVYGLSLRTLRFYEERNKLHPRRDGHARYYGIKDTIRLELIQKGKRLQFSLKQIEYLIFTSGTMTSSGKMDEATMLSPTFIKKHLATLEGQKIQLNDAIEQMEAIALEQSGMDRAQRKLELPIATPFGKSGLG